MIIDEAEDPRFYIADSTIPGAGNGLFARLPLPAGDRFEVIGVQVRRESISDLCSRFADAHKFRNGDYLLIPLGYGGMVNHSASPNLEKVFEDGHVYLRALRDIAPDEELFFTYTEYAQERFGLT
jgi:hypothetical protein